MDLRFLSYYYSPLKVIGLASMSSFTKTRWGSGPILLAQTNENSHRHRPKFKVSAHRVAASFRYIRAEIQFSIRSRRFYPQ
uniref:Uncharacterized protein n=1 Tax=Aegilops tauschii subsp. strangulata TaxID=200361 RepID=A0A453PHX9_AEGTS